MIENITACVAIDTKTIEFLRVGWPTWKRYRPEMWSMPWLCIWDRDSFRHNEPVTLLIQEMGLNPDQVKFVAWPPDVPGIQEPQYATQREKMLTSWVYVPALHVTTDWWMKIDADAIATKSSQWLESSWFEPDGDGEHNCWISSPWSYTKPESQMSELDDWADTAPGLQNHARLDLPYDPTSNKCRHPRMASWLSYYRTEWTRLVVEKILVPSVLPLKLPVPSQDGFHWYVAERGGFRYLRTNQKKRGWGNISNLDGLKRRVDEAMSTDGVFLSVPEPDEQLHQSPDDMRKLAEFGRLCGPVAKIQEGDIIERSMHDTKPLVIPPPPVLDGSFGVLYMNVGMKHALNLLVSVMSLSRIWHGRIAILAGCDQSEALAMAIAESTLLPPVEVLRWQAPTRKTGGRGIQYANKTVMHQYSPFDRTVFLDADTLVVGTFGELFPRDDFVTLTQFANWTTSNAQEPVRKRVEGWRDICPVDVAVMLGNPNPAINTGVIGFTKESGRFFKEWREVTLKKVCFICDEIAAQLIFYKHPHQVADERFNCSIVYSLVRHGERKWREHYANGKPVAENPDPRIWHGHGNKFIRRPYAREMWMPFYEKAVKDNVANVRDWMDKVPRDRRPETHEENAVHA